MLLLLNETFFRVFTLTCIQSFHLKVLHYMWKWHKLSCCENFPLWCFTSSKIFIELAYKSYIWEHSFLSHPFTHSLLYNGRCNLRQKHKFFPFSFLFFVFMCKFSHIDAVALCLYIYKKRMSEWMRKHMRDANEKECS